MHTPSSASFRLLRPSSVLLAFAAFLILAVPVHAEYKVFLKSGQTINAQKEYEVSGDMAILRLPSGAVTRIKLARHRPEANQGPQRRVLWFSGRCRW